MKIGDNIECIENKWSVDTLVVGDTYKIIGIKHRDGGHIDLDVENEYGDILKSEPSLYFAL